MAVSILNNEVSKTPIGHFFEQAKTPPFSASYDKFSEVVFGDDLLNLEPAKTEAEKNIFTRNTLLNKLSDEKLNQKSNFKSYFNDLNDSWDTARAIQDGGLAPKRVLRVPENKSVSPPFSLHFEPVAKDFLYKKGSPEWQIVNAADGGDLLNHVEASNIFNDDWVSRKKLSPEAALVVRRDLLNYNNQGTDFLFNRLKERRKDFRPEARKLWVTKALTSGFISGNDTFNQGVADTTKSRILSELQLKNIAPVPGAGSDYQSIQKVAGKIVRVLQVQPIAINPAPEYAKPVLPPVGTVNPQMLSSNAWMHGDNLASDTSPNVGPVSSDARVLSMDNEGILPAMSPAFAFDSNGKIITMRFQGTRTDLLRINPDTLHVEASMELPARPTAKTVIKNIIKTGDVAKTVNAVFSDTSGGAYFYLDDRGRAIIPAADHSLWIVGQNKENNFHAERRIELEKMEGGITGVMPVWPMPGEKARHAWVASNGGSVGLVNLESGALKTIHLPKGENIENSFPAGENGAFIVSDKAMYRFVREGDTLKLSWRTPYPTEGQAARQFNSGSGTTPTLMGNENVVIVDGLKPTGIHVYSQADGKEVACTHVFSGYNTAAVENSVIAHENILVVANSAGYLNPLEYPKDSLPGGLEAFELQGNKLLQIWSAPHKTLSATPKLSSNGLIYAYSGDFKQNGKWDWSLIGIDLKTGKQEYSLKLSENTNNPSFDNAWATFSIGPSGLVGGNWNGLFEIRDRVTN